MRPRLPGYGRLVPRPPDRPEHASPSASGVAQRRHAQGPDPGGKPAAPRLPAAALRYREPAAAAPARDRALGHAPLRGPEGGHGQRRRHPRSSFGREDLPTRRSLEPPHRRRARAFAGRELHSEEREESAALRSEEHTSELQSRQYLVCRLLLEKKKKSILSSHIFTSTLIT